MNHDSRPNYGGRAFDRYNFDTISAGVYNLIIGSLLTWGFVLTALIQRNFHDLKIGWPILIGYFVCVIAGTLLARGGAFMSLIGYHLIVAPIGVIIGPFIAKYSTGSIQHAAFLTGGITFAMMGAATFFPQACRSMGTFLFWGLLGLIGFEICNALWFHFPSSISNYIGVVIFSLYIAYDWAEAQSSNKTVDNAVDAVIQLYLNIVNLFLRILASSSSSSND